MARRVAGDAVTYSRGDLQFSIPLATQGRTRWEQRDAKGFVSVIHSVDWLIPVESMEVTPQKHDRISVTLEGAALVFVVMPFSADNRVFRYHGTDRTTLRVYTKLLSEVTS